VVRELRLTNLSEPAQQPRTVLHLHYQAWPDFGVPDHPAGVVNFIRLFRSKLPPSSANKPTIVHCSAGVGRSGTFIAVDRLMQTIHIGKQLDVFGVVHEMRLERCHMVQNEQQYIFIHHCLLYALENFYPQMLSASGTQRTSSGGAVMHHQSSLVNSGFTASHHFPSAKNPNVFFATPATGEQAPTKGVGDNGMVPQIQVGQHQNTNQAFAMEDDEGIAESGL